MPNKSNNYKQRLKLITRLKLRQYSTFDKAPKQKLKSNLFNVNTPQSQIMLPKHSRDNKSSTARSGSVLSIIF